MNWLTRFSLRNIAAVLILVILVTGTGIVTAMQLKMEAMPDIRFPVIVAVTPYPGASPEDIAKQVTEPIEKEIMGIEGVDKVTSISADSTSVVVAQFGFDADLDQALQQMKEGIDRISLPEEVMDTTFNRFGFNTFPMINFTVSSDRKKIADLERWVNDTVKPELESVDGVGEVKVKGEGPKAVYIRLKPQALKEHNLSLQQVRQMLASAQMSLPVGDLHAGTVNMPVRINQKITSIEELKNLELTVQPNITAGIQDAFNQLGQSMQSLGQTVGGLGQGLGQVSQGLGQVSQGLGQVSEGTRQLARLQAHAQQVQAEIVGIQIELNKTMEALQKDPHNGQLQQKSAVLRGEMQAKQDELAYLSRQLQAMLAKMPQSNGKGLDKKAGTAGMPSSQGNISKASAGKPQMKEGEIKTVKLKEIAAISESAEDHTLITRTNGKPSVNVEVIKNPDDNVVEVADQINEKLDQLAKNNGDIHFTMLFDQSEGVKESIHSMVREGLLGALFAALIILLFLRNIRMTLISVVSIPVSILAALILLKQADITLNIMTLGGLAVAIGRVVDDSIVVIENIYRHLMKGAERTSEVIRLATREVASAITSSTMTTVAVFVPLSFIEGIIGEVFYPFALTVAFALVCSLVVAVTIVPVLAKLLALRGNFLKKRQEQSRLAKLYKQALAWSLNHKKIVLVGSTLLLLSSFALVPLIGTSFLPSDKEKAMNIEVEMPSGTDLDKTNRITEQIEQELRRHREVELITSSVGNLQGEMLSNGGIGGTNRATIFVTLADNTRIDSFLEQMRKKLKDVAPGAVLNISEVNSISPATNSIEVSVTGASRDAIKKVSDDLTLKMQKVHGLANVKNNLSEQKELVTIELDQAKAAGKGLVAQQVALSVRGLLHADTIFEMENGTQTREVKLGLQKAQADSLSKVGEIEILSPAGELVKLKEIATIKKEKGPVNIRKEDGQLAATITGDVTVKDTGAVSRDIEKQIEQMKLPGGVSVKLGGDTEQMNKSFADLGKAMIVAVFAVYIVILIAFGEATAPFTILFSLPYAIIGGLFGLWISGQPISATALIGALMLIGIVVTNAIVFVDRVQQMRKRGLDTVNALIEAGGTRLRPILMTAFATIFALLPLALGYGEGTMMSQGLAVTVIGGLTSSTLLTLFIVPIVYLFFSGLQERLKEKWYGKKNAEA
ncbi:MAG: efflux RND transporter permease subunit [Thermoactinomyces sp.]